MKQLAFVLCVVMSGQVLGAEPPKPLHPRFPLLDANGVHVVQSNGAVSTMQTCGSCHDTEYIASHSYHTLVGLEDDGVRNIGGGRFGEMNCFLCHLSTPDNTSRIAELHAGRSEWAPTATLGATGVVSRSGEGWVWNKQAFDADGTPDADEILPHVPTSFQCGQCHGLVHKGHDPLVAEMGADEYATERSGQVFSDRRLNQSGMNLSGKDGLSRPWDVHAERLLECTSCHNSVNNPSYFAGAEADKPEHLKFEARRVSVSDFLLRPSHDFALGHTPQSRVAQSMHGSMRRCEQCHNAVKTHGWLPYVERHMQAMNCEACHVPMAYAPAREMVDETLLTAAGDPIVVYRGVDGAVNDPASLVRGYRPVLLERDEIDGSTKLMAHNLITTWSWVGGEPQTPIGVSQLREALLDGGVYRPEVLSVLDTNHDGELSPSELRLDTAEKVEAIGARLEAIGVEAPHIVGLIQPYSLNHGVAAGKWATGDCGTCHSGNSRITDQIELSSYLPGGVQPVLAEGSNSRLDGDLTETNDERLVYEPVPVRFGRYIIGQDRWRLGDLLGLLSIAVVAVGVLAHATLVILSRRGSTR